MKNVRTKLFESVTARVKETVSGFDPKAEVILFGSRARGDYRNESDWDFLILTEKEANNEFINKVRASLYEVELDTEQCFFSLVENKKEWLEHDFLEINRNVKEDGILV